MIIIISSLSTIRETQFNLLTLLRYAKTKATFIEIALSKKKKKKTR